MRLDFSGVTRQFSDFLAAHAARIADLWARQTSPADAGEPPDRARGPRQFVNAVLVALTADDFRPLIAYHHLDAETGIERRLTKALANLTALRHATAEAVREERLDAEETLELASTTADDLEAVGQHLAASSVSTLERRLSNATSESSARGDRKSVV